MKKVMLREIKEFMQCPQSIIGRAKLEGQIFLPSSLPPFLLSLSATGSSVMNKSNLCLQIAHKEREKDILPLTVSKAAVRYILYILYPREPSLTRAHCLLIHNVKTMGLHLLKHHSPWIWLIELESLHLFHWIIRATVCVKKLAITEELFQIQFS